MASSNPQSDSPHIGYDHPTVVPKESGPERSVTEIARNAVHGPGTTEGVVTCHVNHGSTDGAIALVARQLGEELPRVDVTDAIGRTAVVSHKSIVDLFVEWSGRTPAFAELENDSITVDTYEVFDE